MAGPGVEALEEHGRARVLEIGLGAGRPQHDGVGVLDLAGGHLGDAPRVVVGGLE